MDTLIYNSLKNYTSCETNAASKHKETEKSKDKPTFTFSILFFLGLTVFINQNSQ